MNIDEHTKVVLAGWPAASAQTHIVDIWLQQIHNLHSGANLGNSLCVHEFLGLNPGILQKDKPS